MKSLSSDGRERPHSLAANYDAYVSSGTYKNRYPDYNVHVMKVVLQTLSLVGESKPIVDFGCGTGRYLIPLLEHCTGQVVGFDISQVSLSTLARELIDRGVDQRVTLVQQDTELLKQQFQQRKAGLAMILFGVLSHIIERDDRLRTLRLLREIIDPETGRLVISVPNVNRRFRSVKSTREGKTGRDISYVRSIPGAEPFFYHLYHTEGLLLDLEEAGFSLDFMLPESLLPESLISRHRWLGQVDKFCGSFLPPSWGYGLLAVAKAR